MIAINKKPIKATGTTTENEPVIKSDGTGDVMEWQSSDGGSSAKFTESSGGKIELEAGKITSEVGSDYIKVDADTGQIAMYRTGNYIDFLKSGSTFKIRGPGYSDFLTISSTGLATFSNGIAVTTGGIKFPATQSASADANTLDDYEEGSWSPQFNAGTPFTSTPAMDILSAVYTRIGNLVYIQAYIRTDNVNATGAAGVLRITGLPFTAASSNKYGTISIAEAASFVSTKFPAGGYVNTGATHITLTKRPTAAGLLSSCQFDSLTTGVTSNQNSLLFSGTYTV